MKKVLGSIVLAGLTLLPLSADAAPNWFGPSGYMFTPDGTVLPRDCFSIGYHTWETDRLIRPRTLGNRPNANTYKAAYGILPNLEFTTNYIVYHPNGGLQKNKPVGDRWMISAKYAVIPENENRTWSLVGGFQDATDAVNRTYYGLVSGEIGPYFQRVPYVRRVFPHHIRAGIGLAAGLMEGAFINTSVRILPNLEVMYEWVNSNLSGYTGRRNLIGGRFRVAKGPLSVAADVYSPSFESVGAGGSVTYCWRYHQKKHGDDALGNSRDRLANRDLTYDDNTPALFMPRVPVSLRQNLADDFFRPIPELTDATSAAASDDALDAAGSSE